VTRFLARAVRRCPVWPRRRRAAAEAEARAIHSMPPDHPESFTRVLSRRQEESLAALAAELWPDDEYEVDL
jgi:hypothetical protein